jgi:translation initiation factor 2B subunit (eIF-2B alpha/beta/delta family)
MSEEQTSPTEAAPLMPRIALSGAQLRTMAQSRGFAIDDTTGDRMIQSLEAVIDTLDKRWQTLVKLQQAPPMSTTATARWVSDHMKNTATDVQGLLTQLQQARTEFPTYIEAIKLAKRNYQAQEAESQDTFTKILPQA